MLAGNGTQTISPANSSAWRAASISCMSSLPAGVCGRCGAGQSHPDRLRLAAGLDAARARGDRAGARVTSKTRSQIFLTFRPDGGRYSTSRATAVGILAPAGTPGHRPRPASRDRQVGAAGNDGATGDARLRPGRQHAEQFAAKSSRSNYESDLRRQHQAVEPRRASA